MAKHQDVEGINKLKDAEQMWENLPISNDFLFNKMMENPDICKRLLEIILEVKIDHIEYLETQKSIRMEEDGRGVRLDVYVADKNHHIGYAIARLCICYRQELI